MFRFVRRRARPPPSLLGSPIRNLALGIGFTLSVIVCATVAYWLAGWSIGDAFYMVIITVYTVGFGETRPIDTHLLRGITVSTIMLGCTGMIFVTGALVQYITLNQLNQIFGLKRMSTQIGKLNRHVIICGHGRIGSALAHELHAGGADFVVLEQDEASALRARDLGYHYMHADATDEDALRAAGIERARILATVLANDAANVFITLSARSLNPNLEIIARGELPSTERKLLLAGAHRVVPPTHIGAERIAEMILFPATARFILDSDKMRDFERVLRSLGLDLEVIAVEADSLASGQTIAWVEQQAQGTFFIVRINRRDGDAISQPARETTIGPGDGVVIVGRGARAQAVSDLFTAREVRWRVRHR